jgi:ParB family transcriptional regulator, chromosome partitioning protein
MDESGLHQQLSEQNGSEPEQNLQSIRRRLGRGLNSLMSAALGGAGQESDPAIVESGTGEYLLLDESRISRNPFQPRKEFDEDSLNELCESIGQHGILQPLIVRAVEGGYQLVAGERRLIAARKAGLAQVPCRIVEYDDKKTCEIAIVENVQRTDLNDLEKAQAFQEYLDRFGGSIEELARQLGKDRSTVSNWLRLLELPDFVKIALSVGRISAGHARALLPLNEEADQIAMCQRIQSEHLSVRQTEEEVRQKNQDPSIVPMRTPEGKPRPANEPASSHVLDLQRQLRELLGAKVEIRLKGKDAGKLIVHFGTNDEFERIVGFLRKAS